MEETILDWNVPNWITVTVMVLLSFAVIGFVGNGVAKMIGKGGSDAAA